ncbi:MFS transporter [Saccharopolyspora sp. NPDC050642]|uniref:MFS transporter n=1 Tax=Saccharopolyspora sp. NPDC050642 TaxID=3157099 RepID=UPI0033CB5DAE
MPALQAPGTLRVRPAWLVVALLLAVGSYQLNNTMVAPANPQIINGLGTTTAAIGLAQTLFFLVSAIASVVVTRLSDWVGRRRALLAILGVMILGEALCAIAPSAAVYIAGRAISGSSGAVFAFAFLILRETMTLVGFSRALAIIAAIKSGVGGFESVAGGAIADFLGFRGVFWFMIAFTGVAMVAARWAIPEVRVVERQRLDWPGSVTISLGFTGVLVALSQGGSWGWGDVRTLGFLIGGVVFLALFPVVERRHPQPLMNASRLASRASWPLLATNVLVLAGAFAATGFVVPLLSQSTSGGFGMSATLSALLYVMPVSTVGFLVAPIAGWLAPRVGWRRLLVGGLGATVAAMVVLSLFASDPVVVFAVIVVLGGCYTGLVLTSLDGLGVLLSPPDSPGSLTGLNTAAFGVGASLGTAIASTVITQISGSKAGNIAGFTGALWVCTGLALAGLLVSLLIPREGVGVVDDENAVRTS